MSARKMTGVFGLLLMAAFAAAQPGVSALEPAAAEPPGVETAAAAQVGDSSPGQSPSAGVPASSGSTARESSPAEPGRVDPRVDEGFTGEGRKAKDRANSGGAVPTRKPSARVGNSAPTASLDTAPEPSAPSLGGVFGAITQAESGSIPPDPTMAAGPQSVVVATNGRIKLLTKSGNELDSRTLTQFFAGLGTAGTDGPFDPKLAYDPYLNRFWFVAVSRDNAATRSNIVIAVSNDDRPANLSTSWRIFSVPGDVNGGTDVNQWCDYPQIGFDRPAIYITCNMFSFPSGTTGAAFQNAKLRVMTKGQFLAGTCCTWWDFADLREGASGADRSYTVQPALMYGAPPSIGAFLVNAHGRGGAGSTMEVRRVLNPERCCIEPRTGPTLQQQARTTDAYDAAPDAEQSGGTPVRTGDTRLLYAYWRANRLSFGQTLACSSGAACSGFTEFNVLSYPSMTTVNDFTLDTGTVDNFYGQAAANDNGDATLVYARSSSTTFPGSAFVGIPNPSVCTGCIDGPETTLAIGASAYAQFDALGRNRWGDYYGASPDPDGTRVWVHGEAAGFNNSWYTMAGVTRGPLPPFNDDFRRQSSLFDVSGSAAGSNVRATKEPGEPLHAGAFGGASTWWTYTAPYDGRVTVDTFGSTFDTLLGVYVGSTVQGLSFVAGNDDIPGVSLQSRVSFDVRAGTAYKIAVDGFSTGNIRLNYSLNRSPEANAGPDQIVPKDQLYRLEGRASDPEHQPLSYLWTQVGGPTVTILNRDQLVARVPDQRANSTVTLRFQVTDSAGSIAADLVTITMPK